MTRDPMTPEMYSRKVSALRARTRVVLDERQFALKRAVLETVRNPTIARAVARSLRAERFDET